MQNAKLRIHLSKSGERIDLNCFLQLSNTWLKNFLQMKQKYDWTTFEKFVRNLQLCR